MPKTKAKESANESDHWSYPIRVIQASALGEKRRPVHDAGDPESGMVSSDIVTPRNRMTSTKTDTGSCVIRELSSMWSICSAGGRVRTDWRQAQAYYTLSITTRTLQRTRSRSRRSVSRVHHRESRPIL